MALANVQELAKQTNQRLKIHHHWRKKTSQLQVQLAQLRRIFENASFLLVKSDFDRLASMEESLKQVKQKINLLCRMTGNHLIEPLFSRKIEIKKLAGEIGRELVLQQSRLNRFKKEKFSKQYNLFTFL